MIAEFDGILRFWMKKGASGFRVDAVNHMFEDELFRDEPVVDPSDPLSYGYTNHMYTNNLVIACSINLCRSLFQFGILS